MDWVFPMVFIFSLKQFHFKWMKNHRVFKSKLEHNETDLKTMNCLKRDSDGLKFYIQYF